MISLNSNQIKLKNVSCSFTHLTLYMTLFPLHGALLWDIVVSLMKYKHNDKQIQRI